VTKRHFNSSGLSGLDEEVSKTTAGEEERKILDPTLLSSEEIRLHERQRLMRFSVTLLVLALTSASFFRVSAAEQKAPVLSDDPGYFPIAVWVQDPKNAEKYKAAGINLYVGLWRGPSTNQLALLEKAGMRVICSQNETALQQKDNPVIAAWMHGDEPDNAQTLGKGKGYGPPILPEKIIQNYQRIKERDPSRPVLLNLGQGVAWDDYIGRGVRRRHPEDYPEYVKGSDIVSFDIYPVVHDNAAVAGKLEFVANGVKRLKQWTGPNRTVWNCIECTHISNPNTKANPDQIRSEVWMSLIHGSKGLIYFVHQFKPDFVEAGLLSEPENLSAITKINAQIKELAPAMNSVERTDLATVSVEGNGEIAFTARELNGEIYVFAVNMKNEAARASLKFMRGKGPVEVLYENRSLKAQDAFKPYEVHLYKTKAG
jgi:hypothetical protein